MKGDCPKCGFPLNKGNIQIVRPRGKKRPYRIHRRCPEPKPVEKPLEAFTGKEMLKAQDTADAVMEAAREATTGGPVTCEGEVDFGTPPRYRYFMTPDQAERVKRALEKQMAGFGIGFEVIPVPDYQVDQDPDAFANLVEVTVEWK